MMDSWLLLDCCSPTVRILDLVALIVMPHHLQVLSMALTMCWRSPRDSVTSVRSSVYRVSWIWRLIPESCSSK